MKTIILLAILTILAQISDVGKPVEIASPAGAGSGEPNLSVGPNGRVYLSWLEPVAPRGHVLRFATRTSGGPWSGPSTVARGENWFVNSADFPSILAMPDGSLAAHWLANNRPGTEAYDVNISISRDGGKTWGRPIVPHRDRSQNQHGFASMLPMPSGGFSAVWLDGRKIKDDEGDMALMYSTIGADGKLGPESLLDGRVCECCHTSAALTPDGIAVVYRDRSEKEIRDISIVRLKAGRWSQPQPLSQDGWEIDGCPVNGPAISSSGATVAVAWFTGANDQLRVQAVLSADGGQTFGAPIRVDDGDPAGRVDVIALPTKDALVSWVEQTDKGAQVRARRVKPDRTKTASVAVSGTTPARSSAFPRMKKSGDEVVFAWTDGGSGGKVRTAVSNVK